MRAVAASAEDDEVPKLFWTPATLVTDSEGQFGYCQEARRRGEFTGTGGNGLLILSRTSHDRRDQHDADLSTFHRARAFRRLAFDLYPEA